MKKSPPLKASSLQLSILEAIAWQDTSSVQEVERTKLILALLAGKSNKQVSHELGYCWEPNGGAIGGWHSNPHWNGGNHHRP